MNFNRRYLLIMIVIVLLSISVFSVLHILPLNLFSVQQKPAPEPQKLYDYYTIVDEADGHSLMYVPLVVNVGDEVLTEENQRYKIVKIEQNKAFARFVENVNLEKYK
ncbi:stage II sporulation protein P [Pelosinus sp. sgz500959]|uniref:stage II sporulation protein P n=1 Tax=Pelosinus sp. sgz500959 TaxID=3242472 RepID=UPI0036706E4A